MKVVWHCTDPIGPEMAGPGIRAVEEYQDFWEQHSATEGIPS